MTHFNHRPLPQEREKEIKNSGGAFVNRRWNHIRMIHRDYSAYSGEIGLGRFLDKNYYRVFDYLDEDTDMGYITFRAYCGCPL